MSGRLSIVLHTHMPYVEGFGTWPFGEEWLWEAIATSYLPLLDVLDAAPGRGDALAHAGAVPTSSRRRACSSAAWRSCASPARAHALDVAAAEDPRLARASSSARRARTRRPRTRSRRAAAT